MIPVSATGGILGSTGLRPLSHHALLGAFPPLQFPPLPGSYLVESLLRERGYSLARPVATKPPASHTSGGGNSGGGILLHEEQVEFYKEEAARHYLGLLQQGGRTPQEPPGGGRGASTPSPGIRTTSDDPSLYGEDTSPPHQTPRPPLKFSVTAILGEDSRSSSGTPQPHEYGK